MRKLFFLLLILSIKSAIYSQEWKAGYDKFLSEFQAQDFESAIETGQKILLQFETKDTNYVLIVRYMAYSHYALSQFNKAVELYEQTAKLCEKVYGKEDYNYIQVIYNLAVNYTYIGKYSLAFPLMDEVLAFIEKDQTKHSMDYVNTANQNANIYNIAGSYKIAQEIYEEVFDIIKSEYQPEDSMYIAQVNIIAPFYYSRGMWEEAEPFYAAGPKYVEDQIGKYNDTYITTLNNLGEFYLNAGMYEKSAEIYIQFVDVCKDYYGKGSADYATALNNLAVAYEGLEKNKEAEELYLEALIIKEKVYKKESDYYALTLNNLAVLYDNMGEYEKAGALIKECIGIYRSVYGEDNLNYATALSNMASISSNHGQYKDAVSLLEKSLEINKKVQGENSAGYVTALNNLALLYSEMGDYKKAETEFTQLLEISKNVIGEKHTDYATSLYNLANVKTVLGDYIGAEELLNRSLKIQEAAVGKEHSNYVNVLTSLAGLKAEMGNYAKAEELYNNCLEISETVYGDMHPEHATLLNNMAEYYRLTGKYNEAEDLLDKAMKIQEKAYGDIHPNNAYVLSNLANLYIAQGNYRKAEENLLKSLEITEQYLGKEHPDYAADLNNLAMMYGEMGNYDKAEKYYKEALDKRIAFFGEEHTEVATSLNNLGTVYMYRGIDADDDETSRTNYLLANSYLSRALKIDSILLGEDSPEMAMHYNNLAELYRYTMNVEQAEKLYFKTIEIEKNAYGDAHINTATTYRNLALFYIGSGMYDKAEQYALMALDINKKVFGDNATANSDLIANLAYLYEKWGKSEQAYTYYKQVAENSFNILRSNFEFLSEQEKAAFVNTISLHSDMLGAFALNYHMQNNEISGLVYNNILVNKGILLRSYGNMRTAILNSKDTALINKFGYWTGLKQQLAKLYSTPADQRYTDIATLEEKANTIEKEITVSAEQINGTGFVQDYNYAEIKKKLGKGEAALEFTSFRRLEDNNTYSYIYCALLLLPDKEYPQMIELFEIEELNKCLSIAKASDLDYVSQLYGSAQKKDQQLYDLIWAPIDSVLQNTETVYYSPSGMLHKIAFSAINTADNKYLSDKYNLNLLSSTAAIDNKQNNLLDKNAMASIYGGAQYNTDNSANEIWKYLKGTKSEAKNIKAIFANAGIKTKEYLGELASEENFKSNNAEASTSIIHIATHGFFYPDPTEKKEEVVTEQGDLAFRGTALGVSTFVENKNPLMRSGLVLARANDVWNKTSIDGEDGVLTAYEVANMNLQNTQLVVMSACETGLGDIRGSEGVYGLQRAFKMAGADFMVMSLWQVPDKETEEFMTLFYKDLISSKNIRRSFNNTQRTMSKKYDPYYWAAFVLIH